MSELVEFGTTLKNQKQLDFKLSNNYNSTCLVKIMVHQLRDYGRPNFPYNLGNCFKNMKKSKRKTKQKNQQNKNNNDKNQFPFRKNYIP